ncbi:MAG: TetR/AcrR family transcriptional regulator [Bacteroidetes bacterium]|nr:TetR/AcrR family transcriptional regulator [Bacteroidota bacterium]
MATSTKRQARKKSTSSRSTKKAPGKRAKSKEQTKARILKAALVLFGKKGFYKTTTKEISRKAKIAEGTLFNYFKTKEDLALYFFETELQNCIEWYYKDDYVQAAPLPEKLFGIVQHYLDRVEPYQEFLGAVYLRALQPRSKLNPLSLEVQELRVRELMFIRDILEEAEEKEEIPPLGDFGVYALGLGFLGVVTYWLHDRSEGKENTMALLDRALTLANNVLRQGGWEW